MKKIVSFFDKEHDEAEMMNFKLLGRFIVFFSVLIVINSYI